MATIATTSSQPSFGISGAVSRDAHALLERLLLFAVGGTFQFLFFVNYETWIVPRHRYTGIVLRHVSELPWLATCVLGLLPLVWLPIRFRRPSDFAVWILYSTIIAPSPLVALMVSSRHPIDVVAFQSLIILCFALLSAVRLGRRPPAAEVTHVGTAINTGLMLAIGAITLLMLSRTGFQFNISFDDVYSRRFMARELIPKGTAEAYAVAVLTKALVPFALAIGIYYRKKAHLALAILASLVIFSFNGTKITMVLPVVLAGVVWLASRRGARVGFLILLAGHFAIAVAWLESACLNTHVVNDRVVRRIFVVPSQLRTYYWQYFSKNPHVFLQDGLLGSLLGDQLDQSVPRRIGVEFFDSQKMNANSGIWAQGFAHFGYVGLPLVSLLGGWVLLAVDRMASCRSHVLGCSIAFAIGTAWTSKALHTAFLSGGVVVLLYLFYLVPKANRRIDSEEVVHEAEREEKAQRTELTRCPA